MQIFGGHDFVSLHYLPEVINRWITYPDPVVIRYTIKTDVERNVHPKCFDFDVEIDDPVKNRVNTALQSFSEEGGKEIVSLDEEVRRPSLPRIVSSLSPPTLPIHQLRRLRSKSLLSHLCLLDRSPTSPSLSATHAQSATSSRRSRPTRPRSSTAGSTRKRGTSRSPSEGSRTAWLGRDWRRRICEGQRCSGCLG